MKKTTEKKLEEVTGLNELQRAEIARQSKGIVIEYFQSQSGGISAEQICNDLGNGESIPSRYFEVIFNLTESGRIKYENNIYTFIN